MSWVIYLTGGLSLALVALLAGFPVYIAFLGLTLVGVFALFGTAGFGIFVNSVLDSGTSVSFVTIPAFILMGEILFRSGSVEIMFESVDTIVGRLKGRLYLLTIILSTAFGALSGSAVAVVAMLGRSLLPNMVDRGYDKRISAALIQGGACLAPIIPPSILAVIIGSMADVSISKLLIAGVIPGILIAGMMVVWVYYLIWRDPSKAPSDEASTAKKRTIGSISWAIVRMLPFGIVLFAVMGLMTLGIATPTESAATGVTGAIVSALIYRKFSFKMIWESVHATVSISVMILTIVIASVFFGQLLSVTGATTKLLLVVSTLDVSPMVMFLILMIIPFVFCIFLDGLAFMLVAIPIYAPLIAHLNFDPIWFWTLFLINLTVGSLTPPFGNTMFALRAAAPDYITLKEVFSASWPVTWIMLAAMALMTVFPQIITWLPNQMN